MILHISKMFVWQSEKISCVYASDEFHHFSCIGMNRLLSFTKCHKLSEMETFAVWTHAKMNYQISPYIFSESMTDKTEIDTQRFLWQYVFMTYKFDHLLLSLSNLSDVNHHAFIYANRKKVTDCRALKATRYIFVFVRSLSIIDQACDAHFSFFKLFIVVSARIGEMLKVHLYMEQIT